MKQSTVLTFYYEGTGGCWRRITCCGERNARRLDSEIAGNFSHLTGLCLCTHIQRSYVELQDQWNGPYFFFLKSMAQPPVNETAPIFFSRGVFPSYYHVISDFCHIWGPFMAKIEEMCQKSAFLVVPSQNHWKWPTFTPIGGPQGV